MRCRQQAFSPHLLLLFSITFRLRTQVKRILFHFLCSRRHRDSLQISISAWTPISVVSISRGWITGMEAWSASVVSPTRQAGTFSKALRKLTYSGEWIPSCRWFSRDQALPRAVRGPVDFLALRRLEARRAGVRVGDYRNDMAGHTFQRPSSVYHLDTLVK